jgi:predicted negative regulator of RcsB-dependent stress response
MAEYETEEQQVEALKQWWAENGRAVILGIVLGLGGIFGWRAWQGHQLSVAEDASGAYGEVMQALNADDEGASFLSAVEQIRDEHGGSSYAAMASLAEARYHVEQKDLDAAVAALRWAIDDGSFEEVRPVARLRLARVLNAQGKHDDALDVLDDIEPESYTGLVSEIRGDIYLAQGETAKAREAYLSAQQSGSTTVSGENLQMKIDDLALPDQALADGQS